MSTRRDRPLDSQRRFPEHGSQSQGRDRDSDDRLHKLLENVRRSGTSAITALTKHLRKDRHFNALDSCLASFTASDIPSSPINRLDKEWLDLCRAQLENIANLALIVQASVKIEDPQYDISQFIWLLIDRWSSATKWITYMITQLTGPDMDPAVVVGPGFDILKFILNLESSTPAQTEFMTLPQTVDLLSLLFLGCYKQKGHYYWPPPSPSSSAWIVYFLSKVSTWLKRESMATAFAARLLSLPPNRKSPMTQGFLSHAQDIIVRHTSGAFGAEAAASTFRDLTDCLRTVAAQPGIWGKFISSTFLQDYLRAILDLNLDAVGSERIEHPTLFWPRLHDCCTYLIQCVIEHSPNPASYLSLLIKNGMISQILMGISFIPYGDGWTTMVANAPLNLLLPYHYTSRVVQALAEVESLPFLKAANPNNPELTKIVNQLRNSAECFPVVYLDHHGQRFQTAACSNQNHWETTRSMPYRNSTKLKRCSTCRVVMYCCEACQREDWSSFHARECRHLYRWYHDLTAQQKTILSFKARHDQLRYIEYLVNADLPVPTSNHEAPLIRSESGILVCRLDPSEPSSPTDPAIEVFNFASRPGDIVVRTPRTPLSGYRECYWLGQDDNEVNPRLAMLESDSLLEDPQSVILAQGIFPFHTDKQSMHLLAKLRNALPSPPQRTRNGIHSSYIHYDTSTVNKTP
ncbi:hypothetical protein DFP72DRAFT_897182 [Ephemerocybe angulata]|uniref:MYND-type domain-containing protein n=1 Tax=Ephemerocybe angulata TaxID=980116 RepID=A0A8H6HY59_9AGAR|nr:hypothetical protein DFP72DRAFT_897182 [Tulosesus angulatus]